MHGERQPFGGARPHSGVGVILTPEEEAILKEEYKERLVANGWHKGRTLKQLHMSRWLYNKWLDEDEGFRKWTVDQENELLEALQGTNVRVALDETLPDSFRSRSLELKMRDRRYREAEQPKLPFGAMPQRLEISFVPTELPEKPVDAEVKELPSGED